MSGHSHWAGIKHKKTLADAKRSQAFSKLAREIIVAVRQGSGDMGMNPKLRAIIEKAKAINMPTENVERAIKRGAGELGGEILEEILFEAYGPGGTAILIEGITDNKKRSLMEIKKTLEQNGGKMVSEGALKWKFERRGVILIDLGKQDERFKNKEELELKAIESGAEDLYWHESFLDIYTNPTNLEKVKRSLEEKGIKVDSSSLEWVTKEEIVLNDKDKEACQKLFEELDGLDSVQEIYSNLKL